jgi:hypothetical protein
LGCTTYATLPLPSPEAMPVTCTHPHPLVAVHSQSLRVVMLTLPLPPAAACERSAGEVEYVQGGGRIVRGSVAYRYRVWPPAVIRAKTAYVPGVVDNVSKVNCGNLI